MVPTIDIGNISVTAGFAAFIATVWTFICRAFTFLKDKAVFFFCATRTGRSVAEFVLFGVIYAIFGRGISWLVTNIGGFVFSHVAPPSLQNSFDFLANFIPLGRLIDTIVYGFTLWRLSFTIDAFFAVWHRNIIWLNKALQVGRL